MRSINDVFWILNYHDLWRGQGHTFIDMNLLKNSLPVPTVYLDKCNTTYKIYPPKTSLMVHTLLCYYVTVSGFLLILQSLLDFLVSGIVFFMVLVGLSDPFTLTGVTN